MIRLDMSVIEFRAVTGTVGVVKIPEHRSDGTALTIAFVCMS